MILILKIILFCIICFILYSVLYSVYNYNKIGEFFWIKKKLNMFDIYIPNILWENTEQYYLNKYLDKNDVVLQLGGNIGTSCIFADKILDKKNKQMCVEPNLGIIKILEENKIENDSKFLIIDGVITNKTDVYLNNKEFDDIAFTTTDKNTGIKLKTYRLDTLEDFNVLFADCEGCLVDFIKEYPELLTKINKIIYEKDNTEEFSYDYIENLFKQNNFIQKEKGFVCVWTK